LSARQANRRPFWQTRGDFEGSRRTCRIPDFDRPVARSRHNLGPVWGERHRQDPLAVGVRLLAKQLQFVCQTSPQACQFWPRRGDFEGKSAPKSQTLIVLSYDMDTILVPSGENATDSMVSLWAFVFSATQLMSIAIILRTRDVCIRQLGDMWDHERLQARRALEGSRRRHATANRVPQG
jgi:hypothetical protein